MSKIGLHFRKIDLHVHTPASADYADKSATPEQIVEAALGKNLYAIAITDHQTGNGIDGIKAAAVGTDLTILPGVEINATGGESGIHIICIFDVDKGSNHVNQFLNTLGIYDKDGKHTTCTDKSVAQIALELDKYDQNAILILAHCHSTKGVLGDMKGAPRAKIFEARSRCLLGAEASENNFLDKEKQKDRRRVVDLLDGSDSQYGNLKLGVYQSSDAHKPSDIGTAYSWFNVDDSISIEDIRQSLIDRDTRIRQPHEYNPVPFPVIRAVRVKGGFLDGNEFVFNNGLNSILGGKGSGKSLAVELLRFGLDQSPTEAVLQRDHEQKLSQCLKVYGSVEIVIIDESGKEYVVKREFKPNDGNPVAILDALDKTQKSFAISEAFPCMFLSQSEAIHIAQDETGKAQRQFIDRFFDFYRFQQEISRINRELREVDRKFAEGLRARFESELIEKQLAGILEEEQKIDRQLTNAAFDEFAKRERVGRAVEAQLTFAKRLSAQLKEYQSDISGLEAPHATDDNGGNDPAVKRSEDAAKAALRGFQEKLQELNSTLDTGLRVIGKELADYKAGFASVKEKYEQLVKAAGGDQIALSEKRKKLLIQRTALERKLLDLRTRANQIKSVGENRKELLTDLEKLQSDYTKARRERCKHFSITSNGALEVTITDAKDTSDFQANMMRLKRGTWLREEDILTITGRISPRDFVRAVLAYAWKGRVSPETVTSVAEKTKLPTEKIERLFNHFLDDYSYEELLALEYTSTPEDIPQIKYKSGGVYKPLNELSVGQKAVALLLMALGDGKFPIVIDQPEDSLDLRSIWDDVCTKVRDTKELRQFIFTTHNSSVAVASDSDCFSILESDAINGKIILSGSMNDEQIRAEVIRYLEGGKDTYNHKRLKYNIV